MDNEQVVQILSILLPFIGLTAGGAFALWRYLQAQEKQHKLDEVAQESKLKKYVLEAEEAAWTRARKTIDELDERVTEQGERLRELDDAFRNCMQENHRLKAENSDLRIQLGD